MSFLWPHLLWLAPALALLPAAYLWLLRRRRHAVHYSNVQLARAAAGRNWRRHVPPALVFLALAVLLFAMARPTARVSLPWARSTIMLAMDVSLSMRVDDVKPSRLAAAQAAAKTFLQQLPADIDVGLVTFAGNSQVTQRATRDREALATAIDGFQMQLGTAVGDAIVLCLAELLPDAGIDVEALTFGSATRARGLDEKSKAPPKPFTPVAPGSYRSAAIILLSDGRRTVGVETLDAAKMAADRGIRIYVVGLGTVSGTVGGPEGLPIYMQLDEATLREVARITGGDYHHADSAETLHSVYRNLGTRLEVVTRETELTALLAIVAALLVLAAATLSALWFRRLS